MGTALVPSVTKGFDGVCTGTAIEILSVVWESPSDPAKPAGFEHPPKPWEGMMGPIGYLHALQTVLWLTSGYREGRPWRAEGSAAAAA